MKLGKWTLLAAIFGGLYITEASAQQPYAVQPVGFHQAVACDCGEPACGCETTACEPACGCEDPACGCETVSCDPACGCEDLAACDSGCDSACDAPGGCGGSCCLGDCDLGDPCTLFGEHDNFSVGGWLQLGYHTKANGLFNTRPDELQLQQAWLFAEKTLDTSDGFDFGGRIDYLYGTDGQNTQAFGSDPRGWDNDWDNGGDYGSAMPQLYGEVGYGDLSIKAGHFYTIIGWEVVPATGNFFYSHAYTFNNSEPFTHTGALATYNASEDVTVWGGYSLGWDSGFDDNGDAFLGGASLGLTDDVTLIYAAVGGRFGEARFNGVEKGYMHSIVADVAVTDSLQYIFQSDLLDTEDVAGDPARQTFGINQYLIKTLSDCWGVGGRFEWWNTETAGNDSDVYALTMGLNYRPHANVVIRPEIRWDWDDDQVAGLEDGEEQTTFGIDSIVTF
ncbi:porin [Roseimaritima ulvae]|uniref:Porin n=1 Tax=Roseimaritima ulvae TaxID=980254 RepID=A0A5B9R9W5_9BACT|nr:porin [Roseimaritima ulvae]QEG43841.1 hypothetical protein UC8_58980 [Roseimaritima ulvae]